MQAYTYTVLHKPSGRYYYGVRKSSTFDLFETYFTSSKLVKQLIKDDGMDAFEIKLRKSFETYQDATLHEQRFLQRVNAVSNPSMLNQAIGGVGLPVKDKNTEMERRRKISVARQKQLKDPEYQKHRASICNTPEYKAKASIAGKLGNIKSLEVRRANPKPRKPKTYKDVIIVRNNETKTVKANQVPAYRKCGWERA